MKSSTKPRDKPVPEAGEDFMNISTGIRGLRRRIAAPERKGARPIAVAAALAIAAVAVSAELAPAARHSASAADVADAVAHGTVASGGGCTTYASPQNHVARIQSCVSENRSYQIVSDVKVTLADPRNGLFDCSYTISVRDDTARNTVARQTRSGCWTTPAPVVVNAIDGHHYHTYVTETLTDLGGGHHDPNTYNSPEQIAGVPAPDRINPDWTVANRYFSRGVPLSAFDLYRGAGGTTQDNGIVMLRLFIPAATAAGGNLLGDDRGFTSDPSAAFRGVLVWDTSTGDVAVTVAPSTTPAQGNGKYYIPKRPIAALPIAPGTGMVQAFAQRDQVRDDNRVGVDPASRNDGGLHVRLSLLNSLTNGKGAPAFGMGAWSVDFDMAVTRDSSGMYQLHVVGNGYPALEAYYYPKYPTAATGRSVTIARRSIAPLFEGYVLDSGGGLAARDDESWNICGNVSPTVFRCHNTVPYSKREQKFWPLGIGGPSHAQWDAYWDTSTTQTKAM
jgi:hypothetical protein